MPVVRVASLATCGDTYGTYRGPALPGHRDLCLLEHAVARADGRIRTCLEADISMSSTMPGTVAGDVDEQLAAEAAHLTESRAALATMREDTAKLKPVSGDWVSERVVSATLAARVKALRDDPTVPLFFGRLDYAHDAEAGDYRGERYYVGRRHVHDAAGDPMVVDWRAPVSLPFYRANRQQPMGLSTRRRFGFAAGRLTAYEDEVFDAAEHPAATAVALGPSDDQGSIISSQIVTAEIERPRTGPMRDIVATIQPEQDEIVRTDLAVSVCVQGAPGTGKTVGLHRVAYLLYAFRDRLRRGGALVIGPNREFLRYIEQVLPALGEVEVAQATLTQLVNRVPVRGADTDLAATVKGDARMAEVLRRALWSRLRSARDVLPDGLLLPRGSRRWRLPADTIDDLVGSLTTRGVRYGAGRDMLAQRIAHAVLLRMESAGETTDDRVQNAVARTRQVRGVVDALWPAVDPARLVFELWTDAGLLASAADGLLTAEEQAAIGWPASMPASQGTKKPPKPPRTPGAAPWSLADAVLVDEVADMIERTPSLTHVVLDEAQDLSAMQCRAVGRRCSTGSLTVLGDIAQGTTPWATDGWQTTLAHLGKPDARYEELVQGFRVPRQIIDFAARLLPDAAPGLEPPTSVRQAPGSLDLLRAADAAEMAASIVEHCGAALERDGSVGVIAADEQVAAVSAALRAAGLEHQVLGADSADEAAPIATLADLVDEAMDKASDAGSTTDATDADDDGFTRLSVVPATIAKGLEYDEVIVVEPARIVAAEARGLRRLYVVLTRAVSRLTVLHVEPLPAQLVA
jgi:DNA helicase IV